MKKHRTIPIFVPHLGCPNDCSFCNQKKITGADTTTTAQTVRDTVTNYLKTIDRANATIEVGFFGGSFTGIDSAVQEELLSAAFHFLERGKIDGIRLSTRPDYIDKETLSRLKRFGVSTVELGVQSMIDRVLAKNLRGHTAADTVRASHMIKESGIGLGHQIMPGLPGDSAESFAETVGKSIALAPDCTRIYPTLVIRDTLLARWYSEGSYTPLSLDEAVSQSKEALKAYRKANITVIRVGLLGSDSINTEADVLAGPYHPAFGELVESALVYDEMAAELLKHKGKAVQIRVHPRFVSVLVGQRRENIKHWSRNFMLREIHVVQDESIALGEWRIVCI